MQLEATLSSFLLHAKDTFLARVVVLYAATTTLHQSQYDLLARQYGHAVDFVRETDFRPQLLHILTTALTTETAEPGKGLISRFQMRWRQGRPDLPDSSKYLLFLVDDNIFIRDFRLGEAVDELAAQREAIGFSLRLGRNTTHCYSLSRPQSLPDFRVLKDGILSFNWAQADGDFSYPLEISSSIYSLVIILALVKKLNFGNPNTLESALAGQVRHFARRLPNLLCYQQSAAFCAPVNRVQDVYQNRAGEAVDLSVEHLSALFGQGQRISLRQLEGFVPSACHQEVALVFEERVP